MAKKVCDCRPLTHMLPFPAAEDACGDVDVEILSVGSNMRGNYFPTAEMGRTSLVM